MYNLLTEPLIRFNHSNQGTIEASLPEVYAALMVDEVEAFPALRPHQRHAWHSLLVQLGAMAMHQAGLSEPPDDAGEWCRIIRCLTKDESPEDEPWHLVVDDITKPAFMQQRATSPNKSYGTEFATPDAIDSPDTAKNHDLKSQSVSPKELDSWIFALITGQTTDAHLLQNPGISRISGKGSRLAFSITPSTRFGRHVRRDMTVLLEQWDFIGEDCETTSEGLALLWTIPWDGKTALSIGKFHKLYIEISRQIRLAARRDKLLYARKAGGNSARIAHRKEIKGRTGDPWIPVNVKREKAMTLPPGTGFTYKQVSNCLNMGDWQLPLLCRPTNDERTSSGTMYLIVRGIAPGDAQNKTGGYHERIIPLRHGVVPVFGRPDDTNKLGRIAKDMVDDAGKVEKVLQDAILTFIAKGDDIYDKDKFSQKKLGDLRRRNDVTLWLKRLNEMIDARFFEDLQDEFESDDTEERGCFHHKWLWNGKDGVIDCARQVLSDAQNTLKCPSIERYRAIANSDNFFVRNMNGRKSGFPELGYTAVTAGE